MKPLVSVIIPTYNRAHIIRKAVESVLNQTYRNIEVIVVDDCSIDNTEDVICQIDDNRLKYYRLDENRRACFARNYGFSKSAGEIIALHDSDDIWHKDKLEKQIQFLLGSDFDFVFCGMNRIKLDGSSFYYPSVKVVDCSNFYHQELCNNVISTQTMLMKRQVFETVKFDESFKRYQDWDFSIRVSKKFKIGYLNEALVDSTMQENSITVTISAYECLSHLYQKYEKEIQEDRIAYYSIHSMLGDLSRKTSSKTANKHYLEALKMRKNTKLLIKYMLSLLNFRY